MNPILSIANFSFLYYNESIEKCHKFVIVILFFRKDYPMIGFYEDEKFVENGIAYPFKSHIQESEGQSTMVGAHYHTHIEILYCLSGQFRVILDGVDFLIDRGDMMIINSMEVHHVFALSEEKNQYIVIRFKPELLYTTPESIFESKYVLPFTLKSATHQKRFPAREIRNTFIPDLLNQILQEDAEKKYGFELAIRNHIGRIFLWILRSWNEKSVHLNLDHGLNAQNIQRLQKVFDYVDANFNRTIDVQEVAELCNMSYSYFSRFFKAKMHQNFSDYVNFMRVTKAANMLTTTDESVTDIGLTVGFSTTSYFIEQFKSFKELTPLQYRKNFKEMVNASLSSAHEAL